MMISLIACTTTKKKKKLIFLLNFFFFQEFEGYDSDLDESHASNDVKATGFKLETNGSYKAINGIGQRAKKLWTDNGGKDTYRLELFTALRSIT
jgi:hypothetical protein